MKKVFGILALSLIALSFVVDNNKKMIGNQEQEEQGIKFKSMTLDEAKKKAVKNEMLIFIDAYTSWCGPCKKMAATSFKNAEVGELFNSKFINLKIDVEKDVDGAELAKQYKVSAFPTLLFIDGNGKLVKQALGYKSHQELIALANSIN